MESLRLHVEYTSNLSIYARDPGKFLTHRPLLPVHRASLSAVSCSVDVGCLGEAISLRSFVAPLFFRNSPPVILPGSSDSPATTYSSSRSPPPAPPSPRGRVGITCSRWTISLVSFLDNASSCVKEGATFEARRLRRRRNQTKRAMSEDTTRVEAMAMPA